MTLITCPICFIYPVICLSTLPCSFQSHIIRKNQKELVHPKMASSTGKEVAKEIPSLIRVYKDGLVERLFGSTYVPPSLDPVQETGVSSKDIIISQNPNISARLYLPKLTEPHQKVPILVYYHGGGFCLESAFSLFDQRYLNSLVSEAQVLAVSVEYRLAPEHPLPAAYDDSWAALQWVTSHSLQNGLGGTEVTDSWIKHHADFGRVFLGGDSAGGNIAHNMVLRAGVESLPGKVKIFGAFLSHPYFWGSKPMGSEPTENIEQSLPCLLWNFVYPAAPGGIDNPMINPMGPGADSLAGLACSRLLVCVAGKDQLRDRNIAYYNLVKESGWSGELELYEVEGEDHAFHVMHFGTENSKKMIKHLASFLAKE